MRNGISRPRCGLVAWTVGLVGAGLLLLDVVPPVSAEPVRPGQEAFIKRAVFADGRLWLLSDAGVLSSLAEGEAVRRAETVPRPIDDLCVQAGDPIAIGARADGSPDWALRRWTHGDWILEATGHRAEPIVALDCSAERISQLTSRHLRDLMPGGQEAVALSDALRPAVVATVHGTAESLFVGLDAGEWGGGLSRIDRRSGAVAPIERAKAGAPCNGPLDSACDPVNGIAVEPWQPDCLAIAVGLVHFIPSGRIVQLCDDDVRQIFAKPYVPDPHRRLGGGASPALGTVAFFGLARDGGDLMAVGIDGLYRIRRDGRARITPLPAFTAIDGVEVSFAVPHFVLVSSVINQRRSLSGSVPMLVPR